MKKEERIKLYDEADVLWGRIAQYDQMIEEMGELIVAINKYKRKCLYGEYKGNKEVEDNLVEELADVKMCLEQLSIFAGEDKVEHMLDVKLNKLKQEIEYMKSIKK